MLIFIDSYCDTYRENTVVSVSITIAQYALIRVVVKECEVALSLALIDKK